MGQSLIVACAKHISADVVFGWGRGSFPDAIDSRPDGFQVRSEDDDYFIMNTFSDEAGLGDEHIDTEELPETFRTIVPSLRFFR
jgi:hypothetical protein